MDIHKLRRLHKYNYRKRNEAIGNTNQMYVGTKGKKAEQEKKQKENLKRIMNS